MVVGFTPSFIAFVFGVWDFDLRAMRFWLRVLGLLELGSFRVAGYSPLRTMIGGLANSLFFEVE